MITHMLQLCVLMSRVFTQELMALENAEGRVPPLGDGKKELPAAAGGEQAGLGNDPASKEEQKRQQAEAYALEMAIHLKRAEREKKKKELESVRKATHVLVHDSFLTLLLSPLPSGIRWCICRG